jgi:predicted P-loop ATPase
VENHIAEMVRNGVDLEEARRQSRKFVEMDDSGVLFGDFILHFDRKGSRTVREVLQNHDKYENQYLIDPREGPGYPPTSARFRWNDGKPDICTWGHGAMGQMRWNLFPEDPDAWKEAVDRGDQDVIDEVLANLETDKNAWNNHLFFIELLKLKNSPLAEDVARYNDVIIKCKSHGAKANVERSLKDLAKSQKAASPNQGTLNTLMPSGVGNITDAVADPAICGYYVSFDDFKGEVMIRDDEEKAWRSLTDTDYTRLKINIVDSGYQEIKDSVIREAVQLVAELNSFDSAQDWINSLVWDGVPRASNFLTTHMGAESTPYTIAVANYAWSAMAGRIVEPGCKADMVPILVGAQGEGKTTSIKAMAWDVETFREVSFHDSDAEAARKMKGCAVEELAELRGLNTSKDEEGIKSRVTRTMEVWIEKYKTKKSYYLRRSFTWGTTDKNEILGDFAGHRRWLPFEVKECSPDLITQDCEQLWAEGLVMFKANGIMYAEAERLAKDEHRHFTISDIWEDTIKSWLFTKNYVVEKFKGKTPAYSLTGVSIADILVEAIGMTIDKPKKFDEMRVAKILKNLGFERKRVWIDDDGEKHYIRNWFHEKAGCEPDLKIVTGGSKKKPASGPKEGKRF